MAVLLSNGIYYIAHRKNGAVYKTKDIRQAKNFYSKEGAINQKNKAPSKCAGYYVIDISDEELQNISKKETGIKRKKFSDKERLAIYRKTKGHCYLCGEFVDFDAFEIEHRIPLSKGGTNDLSNLFCSCHCCNTIKQNILPRDFLEKISQIFMYQMKRKYHTRISWRVASKMLEKML